MYFPFVGKTTDGAEAPQSEKPIPKGNERILFIDDEEAITEVYKKILERLRYQVTTHCSSEMALEAFRAAPDSFDIIVTDQTMPGLTGSDMPIIMITGYSSMMTEEKAQKAGIKRFVT